MGYGFVALANHICNCVNLLCPDMSLISISLCGLRMRVPGFNIFLSGIKSIYDYAFLSMMTLSDIGENMQMASTFSSPTTTEE